jgi:3-methyladenine DNA glycosylase/8-oxoguanine DNA glycosylase
MHEFRLTPPPPFGFESTAAFLSPGKDELVDVFDGKRLTRLLDVNGRMRLVLVSSLGTEKRPELIVTLMNGTERDEPAVVQLLSRMLGMSHDVAAFYKLCRQDQGLYGLSSDFYGLKPAQRMHPFEALTLAVAAPPGLHFFRTSVSDLAEAISYRVAYAGDTFFAFPTPRVVTKSSVPAMVEGGLTQPQATQLMAIAERATSGELDLIGLARSPTDAIIEKLAAQDGVGLLGAQLTALLGYGRLESFPSTDPLVCEWIARNYGRSSAVEPFEANQWAEQWGEHRGLVAFHIYAELIRDERI